MIPHQKDAVMKLHILRWKSSRLTQIAYCNQHDIKPHIFSYYKGKLSQGDGGSEPLSSSLVPVELLSSNAPLTKQATDSDLIKISHSNGFSIEVKACSELSSLKPLLDLLRSIA
ncbi:MAG: hypothetical protein KAT04_00890 [Methylococcales bacterium]|nr:hypothetical protein [Methylococcales bacterium]